MQFKVVYRRGSKDVKGRDGKLKTVPAAEGEGHIFKMVRDDKTGKMGLAFKSLCGKGQYDVVGKDGYVRDSAEPNLPMCPVCAEAFKTDPASPWAQWTKKVEA